MNLNQTLLDAARDEVRTDKNNRYKAAFGQEAPQEGLDTALVIERFAALLAMEKQAEFFKFIMSDFMYDKRLDCYLSLKEMLKSYSELELYEIFTTPQ